MPIWRMQSAFRLAHACSASNAWNRPDTKGYGAQVNLAKLTESITVFTEITLVDHREQDFVRFEANLRNVEELMERHLVSGGYDYLLRVVSRSINHDQEQMENLLERNIGIEKYFSYIVLTPIPLRFT
jgi:DNA-binding Lrp family transcriptional regulator